MCVLVCSINCQLLLNYILQTLVSLCMCVVVPFFFIVLLSVHRYWLVVDLCIPSASSNVEILLRGAHNIFVMQTWVAQIVKKSRSHLNIFGARRVT